MPPPGATRLLLYGFQYLQSNLSFIIEAQRTTIQATFVSAAYPLVLRRNQTSAVEESITTGKLAIAADDEYYYDDDCRLRFVIVVKDFYIAVLRDANQTLYLLIVTTLTSIVMCSLIGCYYNTMQYNTIDL